MRQGGARLAVYATAAVKGTILGVLGALLVTLGLWSSIRAPTTTRVPMLVPFGPR